MKKFLAIAISAIFLLGFAASAFAIHAEIPSETQAVVAKGETQITLGGSIRVRGEYRDTMGYDGTVETADKAAYDQRVRLSTSVKVSDAVSGFVMLEAGNGATADTWTWGSGNGASGVYGKGNAKPGEIDVLQAWINYNAELGSIKVGHMPLALGNKLFFDHRKFGDDAIVVYKDIDNLHLAALTAKFDEGNPPTSTALADDANAYVALFAYKGEGYNISGDVTWVNDNDFTTTGTGTNADLYNIGIRGDLNVTDTVSVKADVEFQTGDYDTTADAGPKGDFAGWAGLLGATAKLDPVTLGLEFGYGSGDAWDDTDTDVDSFVTSLSSGIPYITFVHGTRSTNVAGAGNGITNLTYLKGSVSGSPAERMTAKADIVWLQATEDYASGKDDIGFEIDGKMKYKLAGGLVYWVEGGYFFVDDDYAQANGVAAGSEDDAYAIRHGIELTF